jgi:hypothetical protein
MLEEAKKSVISRRAELEAQVQKAQVEVRGRHAALKTTLENTLGGVERAINGLSGSFETRSMVLENQARVLRQNRSLIIEDGRKLDDELRRCTRDNGEFIMNLDLKLKELQNRIDLVLHEEAEIESRRQRFADSLAQAIHNCQSVQQTIDSFTFDSLGVVHGQRTTIQQLRSSLNPLLIQVRDAWARLCEKRVLPGQDRVDGLERETTRLVALCDQTSTILEAKYTALDQQTIAHLSSLVCEGRQFQAKADELLERVKDPRSRHENLGRLLTEHQALCCSLDRYRASNFRFLKSPIPSVEVEFMRQFPSWADRYKAEEAKLTRYVAAEDDFQAAINKVRSNIAFVTSNPDLVLNAYAAPGGPSLYDQLCNSMIHELKEFQSAKYWCEKRIRNVDMAIPESFAVGLEDLRYEYSEALASFKAQASCTSTSFSQDRFFSAARALFPSWA